MIFDYIFNNDLGTTKNTIPKRTMYLNNKITTYDKSKIDIINSEVDDFGNRLTHIRLKAEVKSYI